MLTSFFNDEILKVETGANLVAARKSGRIEPGGCHGEYDMCVTCAIAVTVQKFPTNYGDYVTMLGLPKLLAEIEEDVFERLPRDEATFFPERVIEAIGVGYDLSNIGWALLKSTMLEHEGFRHRLVTKTVTACARFLDPLIAGGRVDSIDANELRAEAARIAQVTATAARGSVHPAHDLMLIATGAMSAATMTLQHKLAQYDSRLEDQCHSTIRKTLLEAMKRSNDPSGMAERLIRALGECSSDNLIVPNSDNRVPQYGASSPIDELDPPPKARAKTRRARVG